MMNKIRHDQSRINFAIACLTVRLATALLVVQGMTTVVKHTNAPAAHTTIDSSILSSSRIRTRTSRSLLCLGATASATSTTTKSSTARKQQQKRSRQQQPQTYDYEDDTNDDDEDDEILSSLAYEVDSFQELQRSTGSEILDDKLQKQIDDTTPNNNVNSFLDTHVTDASYLEKVAMSSIPEQLPQPAVNAFRHRQQQQQQQLLKEKKKKTKIINNKGDRRETHGIEFAPSSKRVNPEEEIELAKMIQRGVWLHKLKTDMETEKGSSISKNEWATLANLDSTTQLRREVATYRRAKQLLVSANMGLVNAVVKKQYYNVQKRDALSYEELIQEGSLGLIRAAELFDPSRGIRFSTYATIWIKGSLSHSHILDGSITLPAREKTKWNKIVKAHEDIIKEKGGLYTDGTTNNNNNNEGISGVSVQDIANRLDMNVEEVITIQSKMNSAKKVLSLDYEYQAQTRGGGNEGGRGGQQLLMDMDKNFQADADLAERTQLQADIIAAMVRNLSPREARLIRLRYGLTTDGRTHTVQECADAMGVSQTRASQLAAKCLKKLREAAEADSLEEYLLTIA
jgi:RNA polymerase primary sigma factor